MTALSAARPFLDRLKALGLQPHTLVVRDSLMIAVVVPGEYWEIEFYDDGSVEIERFLTQGVETAPADLRELLAKLDSPA